MSNKRGFKSQNTIFMQHYNTLGDVKKILCKKYPALSINQTISQDNVPFLHIWKTIAKTEGVQGMPFLPCFHIIVTATSYGDDYENDNDISNETDEVWILFQLHSFHGKVIADETISIDKCNEYTDYNLAKRMEEDRIQICHGIEEVNKEKFTNFLASCELPLLGKIKSVFLIEQFMGEVVLRSRLCEFVLYDDIDPSASRIGNFARCQECDAFQVDRPDQDDRINKKLKDERCSRLEGNEIQNSKPSQNTYQRVFHQTTVSDVESRAVYDQANYLYNVSMLESHGNTRGLKSKKRKKLNSKSDEKIRDIEIKSEPPEERNDRTSSSNLEFDSNVVDNRDPNMITFNTGDRNQVVEDNGVLHMSKEAEQESFSSNLILDESFQNNAKDNIHNDIIESKYSQRKKKHFDEEKSEYRKTTSKRKYKKKDPTDPSKSTKLDKKEKNNPKRLPTYSKTCSICSHTFTNITHFEQDQTRHLQALEDLNQPLSCPLCNAVIETKFQVTEHFASIHSDLNVTCCCECSQIIPNGNNRLRRHILKFHHSAEEKVVCPECGKESSGRTQLEIHLAQYHSDKKIAVCQTCGKGFGTMSHYQLHLRRHHQPRDLQCPHCDKKFESRDQAIKHLIVHTGIKPCTCIQCQYVS